MESSQIHHVLSQLMKWLFAFGLISLVHGSTISCTINGKQTKELGCFRISLRPFCELYGHTMAAEFGPRSLKTVRQKMVEMNWCRNNVNKSISRIKHVFKWAVAEEIIPGSVYQTLMAVPGLKLGRCEARESEPVRPVPQEYVNAIQPFVSKQIWSIIQLQLLTAARPGEILHCVHVKSTAAIEYGSTHHQLIKRLTVVRNVKYTSVLKVRRY